MFARYDPLLNDLVFLSAMATATLEALNNSPDGCTIDAQAAFRRLMELMADQVLAADTEGKSTILHDDLTVDVFGYSLRLAWAPGLFLTGTTSVIDEASSTKISRPVYYLPGEVPDLFYRLRPDLAGHLAQYRKNLAT